MTDTRKAVQLQGELLAKVTELTAAHDTMMKEAKAAILKANAESDKLHAEMWGAIYDEFPEAKGTKWRLNLDNMSIGVVVLEPAEDKKDGLTELLAALTGAKKGDCDCPDCTAEREAETGKQEG